MSDPQPYRLQLAQQETGEPARLRKGRRSKSPESREYEHRGGGQSSSRHDRAARDYDDRDRRDSRNGRPRDNGYGDRDRVRDVEQGRDGERDRRRGEYTSEDRERERDLERRKYDEGVVDKPKEAAKPNFGASGLLAKESNSVQGVQLKYNEPPEARKPLKNWRLYVFKGKEQVDLVHIYKQSAYLIGRDEVVTDIPVAHPSCSKQHAAIQFRQISEKNEYGDVSTSVKPFIIDLESTNGTYVNDEEIPKSRYYELRNTDVIKFGTSSREYVLLHEEASA